jgi:serine/threonine protein kinase
MIGQLLTGRYLFLKRLGAGGFSETYLALDKYLPHHPLCVVKCLKVSPSSTISLETARQLFEAEARILDQLGQHHDQIPTLFAYCHEEDQVYLVQEYIDGENLGDWSAQGQHLTFEEAIELMWNVLPILDYIHSQRVIHRDIKPSNLIRRRQDGRIVLIDFGAACIVPETDSATGEEEMALAIGTPGYMPNEQEGGTSRFSSDLYALGISVIHLLTGVHPSQFQLDPISGVLDWQTHLQGRSLNPKLVAILDRMVQSQSRDRYQRTAEVTAALFPLMGVSALKRQSVFRGRRPSVWQRLKPIAIALLVASGISGWHIWDGTERAESFLTQMGVLSQQPELQLTLMRDLPLKFGIDCMMIAPDNRVLITAGSDHILRFWSLPNGSMLKTLTGHRDTVTTLTMSQDGRFLASGSTDRTVHLWDIASGTLLQTFTSHQQAVTAVAISPDAQTIASGSQDGTIRQWNLQTGALLQTLKLSEGTVTALAYGATPDRLISASSDRQLQVWDLKSGQIHRTFSGHTASIMGIQVVDDHTFLSFGEDRVLAWDMNREELMLASSEEAAKPMTAFLNGKYMVSVYDNGNIRVWTRKAGQLVKTISGQLGQNLRVVFSPNRHYLVRWSPDHRLQVWQMNTSAFQ